MSLEAVRGTPAPFDPRIHEARPHAYQQQSATLLRALLADSEIRESHRENDPRVQDAYSLRCTPQVLGAVGEGLAFAERLVATELNAATDNPLVFDGDVLSAATSTASRWRWRSTWWRSPSPRSPAWPSGGSTG